MTSQEINSKALVLVENSLKRAQEASVSNEPALPSGHRRIGYKETFRDGDLIFNGKDWVPVPQDFIGQWCYNYVAATARPEINLPRQGVQAPSPYQLQPAA